MAIERPLEAAEDHEIPDELFAKLATLGGSGPTPMPITPIAPIGPTMPIAPVPAAFSASILEALPQLPSLKGYEERLSGIQAALDEARVEAASIREELRQKAELLRRLAVALESV